MAEDYLGPRKLLTKGAISGVKSWFCLLNSKGLVVDAVVSHPDEVGMAVRGLVLNERHEVETDSSMTL